MLLTQNSCHCYTVTPVPFHYWDAPFPSLSYCLTHEVKHVCELMNGPLIVPTIRRPSAHFRDVPLAPMLHPMWPRQVPMHTAHYSVCWPTPQSASDHFQDASLTPLLHYTCPCQVHLAHHSQHSLPTHHHILQFTWVSDLVPNPAIAGDQVW